MAKDDATSADRGNILKTMAPEDVVVVGVDTDADVGHPLYDERIKLPLEEELVLSIMHFGVKVPIKVRRNGEAYEAVDGRRRVLHAREANRRLKAARQELVRLRAEVERGPDVALLGTAMLSNEFRRQDPPVLLATKIQRALDRGMSKREVGLRIGRTPAAIDRLLQLLELHPKVQAAVERGKLSPSAAERLASLAREDQVLALEELAVAGGGERVTSDQTARMIRARRAKLDDDVGEATYPLPTKGQLRALAAAAVAKKVTLPADFVAAVRWIAGDLPPRRVPGLLVALKMAATGKRKAS